MTNGLSNKRNSPAKWIGIFLSAFLLLLLLCLLVLPMLFSTTGGKKYLLKMIENRTGFQMEIQELSLSWFGSQEAKGIQGANPKEQIDFSAEEVRSSSSLWWRTSVMPNRWSFTLLPPPISSYPSKSKPQRALPPSSFVSRSASKTFATSSTISIRRSNPRTAMHSPALQNPRVVLQNESHVRSCYRAGSSTGPDVSA